MTIFSLRGKWVFLVLLLSHGCGSDSGGVGVLNDAASPNSSVLNSSELTGKIIARRGSGDALWQLNLPSATYSQYTDASWTDDPQFRPSAQFFVAPKSLNDTGFVLAIHPCKNRDQFNVDDFFTSCVILLDNLGRYENVFIDVEPGRIAREAKLSPDGRLIAVFNEINERVWLQFYDLQGNLVDESQLTEGYCRLIKRCYAEWHPDGSLYVTIGKGRSLFFTTPYNANLAGELSLPKSIDGSIRSFDISPDGKKIVFELINDNITPVVVDLETGKIRFLTEDVHLTNGTALTSAVIRPQWSPDGRWIAVQYGENRGLGAYEPPLFGEPLGNTFVYLFAIPADGENVPLAPFDPSYPTTALPIVTDQFLDQQTWNQWDGVGYYWIQ